MRVGGEEFLQIKLLLLFLVFVCFTVSANVANPSFETGSSYYNTGALKWSFFLPGTYYQLANPGCAAPGLYGANPNGVYRTYSVDANAGFFLSRSKVNAGTSGISFITSDLNIGVLSQDIQICSSIRAIDGSGWFHYGYYNPDTNSFCRGGKFGNGTTANWPDGWKEYCITLDAGTYEGYFAIDMVRSGTNPIDQYFEVDNISFSSPKPMLNILEPGPNQQIKQREKMPIEFEVRNKDYEYLDVSNIEYRLDDDANWIQRQVTGYGLYEFTENAPNETGEHTLTIRTFIDGNWVSDTLNYTVVSQYIDLKINFIKAIQVVEDVDLVAGKATAVKVNVNNTNDLNQAKDVNVRVEFNDQNYYLVKNFYGDHNFVFYGMSNDNYNEPGTYSIEVEIDADKRYAESDEINNYNSVFVTVKDVEQVFFIFVPVQLDTLGHYSYNEEDYFFFKNYYINNLNVYHKDIENMLHFLVSSYPLDRNSVVVYKDPKVFCLDGFCSPINFNENKGRILDGLELQYFLLGTSSNFAGLRYRIIGLVPAGTIGGVTNNNLAGLSEYRYTSVAAHEIGHTIWHNGNRLCEEYWDNSSEGNCANPSPPNCNCSASGTQCLGSLINSGIWVNEEEEFHSVDSNLCNYENTFSFMGAGGEYPPERWTSYDEYVHLFSAFEISGGEKSQSQDLNILLVSGTVDINLNVELSNMYVINGQEFGSSDGNCSTLTFDSNETKLNDYNFSLDFVSHTNPPTDSNYSSFLLGIPFDNNINSVQVICNGALKAERFVSANAPTVSITSPSGDEQWSGNNLIEWQGNDLDGNPLEYVLQYSDDNGSTWNPLGMHITDENFTFDVGMVDGNTQYKIKVIATDGILTGEATSNTFTILNPNIEIEPSREWNTETINNLQNVSQDFNIVNTGNADLNVFDMNVSDNLMVTGLVLPLVLEPGEKQAFSIELNVLDMNLGEFIEDINLGSNDPNQIVKRIEVFGTIEEAKLDFSVSADDINFSSIYPDEDENISVSALIRNLGDLNAENVNVKFYSDYPKELVSDEYTIGLYHFNEGSGNIVLDSSNNEYDFDFNGTNPPSWESATKILGLSSLKFTDSLDLIEAPDNSDWDLTGNATWEFWIHPVEEPASVKTVIAKTTLGQSNGWAVYFESNGKITFTQYGVISGITAQTNTALDVNEWNHVGIVRNAAEHNIKIYLNGVLDKTQGYSGTPNTNNYNVKIGNFGGGSGYSFAGYLDEIRISNTPRTSFDTNTTFIEDKNISFIDANSSEIVLFDWNTVQAGDHNVFVVIDGENLFDEANENNNADYKPVTVYSEPILSGDFNFNIVNDLGKAFDANIIIENLGAKVLDANITLILPEELTTSDDLTKNIGTIYSHTETNIGWFDVNSSQAGLFEIIINLKGSNADQNFSAFTSIRHIKLSDLNINSTIYPDDENIADFNITNYNPNISYAGYYYTTQISGPENISEDKNIGIIYAGEPRQKTAQISEWKATGNYTLTVSLYDSLNQLVDQKQDSFEVIPYTPSLLSYYSTNGLEFNPEFTSNADYFSSAADESNQVMIVYSYDGDLNYSVRNPVSQEWSSGQIGYQHYSFNYYPYLVWAENKFHLVYGDQNIQYRTYNGSWSSEETVAVMPSTDPVITIDGENKYVLFSSESNGLKNIYLTGFNGTWNQPMELTHCRDENCSNPIVLDEGLIDGKLSYAYRKYKGETYATLDSNLMYSLFDVNYFYWGNAI